MSRLQSKEPSQADGNSITLRSDLRPGDVGAIISMHGILYAQERGFDSTFEAYVAGPLADFVLAGSDRERLWLAKQNNRLVGCAAIVAASPEVAQFRWFLVDPSVRGVGLGRKLLQEAIQFARACHYTSLILWTESALTTAGRLYRSLGFRKVEEKPGRLWGVELVEEKYELPLS